MLRISSVALVFLFFVPAAPCQKVDRESEPLQALLSEIRQLRQDLQVAAIAARRAQIVIYRLHEQEMAVERATERLENANSALAQIQMQHKYNAENLKRLEENKDRFENEQERKQYTDEMSNIKDREEALQAQEQEWQLNQLELEQQLKIEQAKLQQLQDQLDRLDKDLENAALQASTRQP
jgi:chromosome segregation ATPase